MPSFTPAQVLHQFNLKALELNESRLADSLRSGKGSHRIQWSKEGGTIVEHDMPHVEELKAYFATFRQYLVQKEPFSFTKLSVLYRQLEVSSETKGRAEVVVDQVGEYLRGQSKLVMDRNTVSRQRVLDVGMYGGMFHSYNPEFVIMRETWANDPALDIILWDELLDILMKLTQLIFNMRHVNIDALRELEVGHVK